MRPDDTKHLRDELHEVEGFTSLTEAKGQKPLLRIHATGISCAAVPVEVGSAVHHPNE